MLLAIETSTGETVLALAEVDRETGASEVLASATFRGTARHEDSLIPAIEAMLVSVGRERTGIRTVAVGVGPGGFTSLRVGIASAKGLALGLGAELVGVASLRALARGACPTEGVVLAMTDTKKREVNAAVYAIDASGSRALLEPMHGRVEDVIAAARDATNGVSRMIVVGDGARAYPDALEGLQANGIATVVAPRTFDQPRADAMVLEAGEALMRGELAGLDSLEPLYVKPSDVKLPAVKLRTSLG